MLKKISLLFFVVFFFLFAGCSNQETINPKTINEIDLQKSSKLHDGTYQAHTKYYDADGFAQFLMIEVHSGIISKSVFTEKNQKNQVKQDTTAWPENADEETLSAIYHKLISAMIKSQSVQIDTVAGATKTSDVFIQLAEVVIKNAKKNHHETAVICPKETYTAESITADGYRAILKITFNDQGKITTVHYDELTDNISRFETLQKKELVAEMCAQTLTSGSLNALPVHSNDPEEYTYYNLLLKKISEQHTIVRSGGD